MFTGTRRKAAILAILISLPWLFSLAPSLSYAGSSECASSSPRSNDYVVTVCIVEPSHNASVTGLAIVVTTVTETESSPGIRRVSYALNGEYLLMDFDDPYVFQLPSDHFVDGDYTLTVQAKMRDGFDTQPASVDLAFNNGVTQPPINNRTFTPYTGSPPPSGQPFVVAAAGDGASGERQGVIELIASWNPDMFLYLGDVYERGTYTEFHNWYGTSTRWFGQFRSITNPTMGNHEEQEDEGSDYFFYWDNVPNFYSYNAAGWHFISLNSNGDFLEPESGQYDWLRQDLDASAAPCSIAYFHHPRYSIGPHGHTEDLDDVWSLLVERDVDVVLAAHDHNYQRWQPLDGAGNVDPQGTVQFVLGTGGHGIRKFVRADSRVVQGFDSSPEAFGALRMELYPDRMAYSYVNISGAILDSGTIACDELF